MIQEWYYFVAFVIAVATGVVWITGKLSSIEAKLKAAISAANEKVLSKMDYHEKHDDDRFGQIRQDLVTIQIRNASKDVEMRDLNEDFRRLLERNGNGQYGSKSIHRDTKSP